MTLAEYQAYLHSLYQGDTTTPSSTDADYLFRTKLLEMAINSWDNEPGILWTELWTTLAASTQDGLVKTVATATLTYTCPTDFRFPGGYVRTTNSAGENVYWEVITPQKAELYKNGGTEACYFTGNTKTGYVLNFCQQPTVGHTINYPYYKTPFLPSASSNVIEMADPWFAIYVALSKLHELDGEGDRSLLALQQAQERMKNMRIRNMMPAWFQENAVPDQQFTSRGTGGFGV